MNVLLVDDDSGIMTPLKQIMVKNGYNVVTAESGPQAVDHLDAADYDILVCGWLTTEFDGLQLCAKARALSVKRCIYYIMVGDLEKRKDALRVSPDGVDDYITSPVDPDEFQTRLKIAARVIKLERENNQKYLAIKRNYYQSIHMVTQMLETYNKHLGGHSRRVGQFSLAIAKKHPGVLPEDYPIVEAAGLLHDIGLVGLPESLVTKSVPEMNGDEKKGYFAHPERGELVLNQVDLLKPVAKLVRMHHEQANGRGFPDGLNEKQIPVPAAIVGAASVYDHLVHHQKIPLDRIPEQLQQLRGYRFSAEIVDLLLDINLEQMQAEAKRTFTEIDIEELSAGMVLASDIRMRTGAFVMAADTRIDSAVIEKLKRYHELGNISSGIFIKK